MSSRDIIFMENQTIEDIDKAEKLESSTFDGIVHDDVSHTSMHDVVGLDNHGDAQNHVGEPECYEEAMEYEHKDQWIEVMQDEMKSLHENHIYELIKLPKVMRALKNKWLSKVKVEEHNLKPGTKLDWLLRDLVKGSVLTLTKYFLML